MRTSPPDYSLKIIVADMLFLFNLYPMKLTAKLSSDSLPNPEKPFRSLPRKSPENSSSTPGYLDFSPFQCYYLKDVNL